MLSCVNHVNRCDGNFQYFQSVPQKADKYYYLALWANMLLVGHSIAVKVPVLSDFSMHCCPLSSNIIINMYFLDGYLVWRKL